MHICSLSEQFLLLGIFAILAKIRKKDICRRGSIERLPWIAKDWKGPKCLSLGCGQIKSNRRPHERVWFKFRKKCRRFLRTIMECCLGYIFKWEKQWRWRKISSMLSLFNIYIFLKVGKMTYIHKILPYREETKRIPERNKKNSHTF